MEGAAYHAGDFWFPGPPLPHHHNAVSIMPLKQAHQPRETFTSKWLSAHFFSKNIPINRISFVYHLQEKKNPTPQVGFFRAKREKNQMSSRRRRRNFQN